MTDRSEWNSRWGSWTTRFWLVLVLLMGAPGLVLAQDELPDRLVEGGLARVSTGGSSASGGYGAVEFGSGRYAAWAGVGSVGGTTNAGKDFTFFPCPPLRRKTL